MKFEEIAEEVQSRRNDRKEPTLDKTEEALEKLGHPEEDYEVILVGGTNGKGSTAEMISRLLQSQGFRTGKFTSPHLVTLRERIEINGEKITEREFTDLYNELKDMELTFFEFMTVAAYQYFSDREVDYAVVEVGMGGRLDATNAAENSVAVITNVGRDHSRYLGDTREEIAEEKAGIIPEEGKYLNGSEINLIDEIGSERNANRIEKITVEKEGQKFSFGEEKFEIPLKGSFQRENLEHALSIVSELEELPENLDRALEDASLQGRMEKIGEKSETILDGAHNLSALEKTVEQYQDGFICIFGVLESKEIEEMIGKIEEKASKIYVTEPDFRLAEDAGRIEEKTTVDSEVVRNPRKALEKAREEPSSQVVVTGSLYLIGDLKKSLEES